MLSAFSLFVVIISLGLEMYDIATTSTSVLYVFQVQMRGHHKPNHGSTLIWILSDSESINVAV